MPDIHHIIVIQIISCMLLQHAEEDAEESRYQNTTLLHAVGDEKGLRRVTVESDLAALVLAQLHYHPWVIEGQLSRFRTSHSPLLPTELKSFVRSTKVA